MSLTCKMSVRALRKLSAIAASADTSRILDVSRISIDRLHITRRHLNGSALGGTANANETFEKDVREHLADIRDGTFEKMSHPEHLKHYRMSASAKLSDAFLPLEGVNALPHPIWTHEQLHEIEITHKEPNGIVDKAALNTVQILRKVFDYLSGFNRNERTERVWINRIAFLETVAGVPGMVAAMTRHLDSLRRLRRDHGWIHTLIEEAENERMHLLTAMHLRNPTLTFRAVVALAQGGFVTFFSIAYLLCPRYCHRFVGYLEEEAVITYTKCIRDIENGPLQHWQILPAPPMAILYWNLEPEATMKDVILNIRADEAHHRIVNHTLGSMREEDYNPYKPGH